METTYTEEKRGKLKSEALHDIDKLIKELQEARQSIDHEDMIKATTLDKAFRYAKRSIVRYRLMKTRTGEADWDEKEPDYDPNAPKISFSL